MNRVPLAGFPVSSAAASVGKTDARENAAHCAPNACASPTVWKVFQMLSSYAARAPNVATVSNLHVVGNCRRHLAQPLHRPRAPSERHARRWQDLLIGTSELRPSAHPWSAIAIGCGDGGSLAMRAASSNNANAGNRPAACTRELRLYEPPPSIGAG